MSLNLQPAKLPAVAYPRNHARVRRTLTVIGGKWRTQIICQLLPGTKRFGELQRSLHRISQRVLTWELRQLERDGIIVRTMYLTIPPKVEYSLTERGRKLELVFTAMGTWAEQEDIPGMEK